MLCPTFHCAMPKHYRICDVKLKTQFGKLLWIHELVYRDGRNTAVYCHENSPLLHICKLQLQGLDRSASGCNVGRLSSRCEDKLR